MTRAANVEWLRLHNPTINVVTGSGQGHCVLPVDSLLLTVCRFTMHQSLAAHRQAHEKDAAEGYAPNRHNSGTPVWIQYCCLTSPPTTATNVRLPKGRYVTNSKASFGQCRGKAPYPASTKSLTDQYSLFLICC